MAVENQNSINLEPTEFNKVIVVGAGPVGLVASLLLSKYHVPHMLVEQLAEPDNHSQAHFINCRSMEILRELNALDQIIHAHSAPTDEWRRFVYCTGLSDLPALDQIKSNTKNALLGVVDHFADIPLDEHSPSCVTHFPQHDFVRLLRREVLKSKFCRFVEGHHAIVREEPHHVTVTLSECQTGGIQYIQTQFVVAADGAHSSTRKQLGIDLFSENGNMQHLINVHFFSLQLSELLRSRIPAMLYFVYSSAGVAVLVAHALKRGEFVAQIPFFPPHQLSEDFNEKQCIVLLHTLIGKQIDVDVKSIRTWQMGVWEASRFRSTYGRCFLIGDAAHQFPPAGGFGMNTGIQDAHNLIWKIATALQSERTSLSEPTERLLASYESERRPVARLNAKISVQNFNKTLKVPAAIGLDLNTANALNRWIACIPAPQALKSACFQIAMQLGLKQVDWLKSNFIIARRRLQVVSRIFEDAKQQTLQLIFPGQDLGFVYRKGWLAGRDKSAPDRFDPLEFKPNLKLGGRMPHFWLDDKGGQQISVLDLPSLMIGPDRLPCYVLLVAGKADMGSQIFDVTKDTKFHPLVNVIINSRLELPSAAYFSFHQGRPVFLPSSYTVLMRPDGHIAWLHIPR
ncbi:MAG: FAD-dependent monooxygenase [Deltaproteobacteria bacterium]|nr:FAD-dependent monooxygenase [Deltaproteobacteria bacterium]